jgi:hypothetical protein
MKKDKIDIIYNITEAFLSGLSDCLHGINTFLLWLISIFIIVFYFLYNNYSLCFAYYF